MNEPVTLTVLKMGALIGQAVRDAGLTQRDFARRVGVSEKHLSRVLTGAGSASPAQLDYWAFALGKRFDVTLDDIERDDIERDDDE